MAVILIIDDRAINREYLSTILKYFNHEIHEAQDGLEGLEVLKTTIPDLIITDILMPNFDGYEFVQHIKMDPQYKIIPIIFYTATYRKEEADKLGKDLEVDYVLSKPAEPELIINTVNKILGIEELSHDKVELPQEVATSQNTLESIAFSVPQELKDISSRFKQAFYDVENVKNAIKDLTSYLEKITQEKNEILEVAQNVEGGLNHFYAISSKLFTLIELNLDMIAEKDELKLLGLFCKGTRKIIDAQYAITGLFSNEEELIYLIDSSGIKKEGILQKDKISLEQPFLMKILNSSKAFYKNTLEDAETIPFFNHEKIVSFLGSPLITSSRNYGFVCFFNKEDHRFFSEEDLRLIETLSAELAILYENIELYTLIQKHAADLQIESRKRKRIEEDLRKNEKMFRQFAENIDEVFFVASPAFEEMIYINSGYQEIWGKTCESLYQAPKSWMDSIIEEDKEAVEEELSRITREVKNGSLKFRIMRPDGMIRYIYAKLSCIKDKKWHFINLIGIASDITEYMQNQKRLHLQNQIQDLFDKSLSLRDAAPKLLQIFRVTFGCNIAELWLIDLSKNTIRNIENSADSSSNYIEFLTITSHLAFPYGKDLPGEVWQLKAPIWVKDYSKNNNYPRNDIAEKHALYQALGFPLMYRDNIFGVINLFAYSIPKPDDYFMNMLLTIGIQIGEYIDYKFTAEQLSVLAKTDLLTGLMNRITMEEELENILKEELNQNLAVFIIGIDRLQLVNQVYGFEFGDVLLKNVAKRLNECKPGLGLLFRGTGAKFGYIIPNTQSTSIKDLTEKLFQSFKSPLIIADQYLIENISIGISIYPKDGDSARKLLKSAEIANRAAHLEGGNQVRYFEEKFTLISSSKLILENDIRQALNNGEFCLYFQPKVDIHTQTITGFEALLRWNHPKKGIVSPLEFIYLAEETGLIIPLGDWVVDEACKTLKELSTINKKLSIAINISIRQLMEHDFIKKLQQVIEVYGIVPQTLQLEVTESYVLSQGPQFKEIVKFLKDDVGVSVAFDDFGTGYSSLSYLTYAHVDVIKIDKSFINGIPDIANKVAIIRGIISIAQTLSIKTVAEGVETETQWNFLSEAGCDEVQGYFCYRPKPKDYMFKFWAKNANLPWVQNK